MDVAAESVIEALLEMNKSITLQAAWSKAHADILKQRVDELEAELLFYQEKEDEDDDDDEDDK